jgi:hypothetical protein
MPWWTWKGVTGALVRRVPASVVNVSSRGCLLETHAPLQPGVVGLLEVDDAEQSHNEVVRVCHAVARAGASVPFLVGTEFLVLDAAALPSVRHKVARLEALYTRLPPAPRRQTGARHNSGVIRTTAAGARRGIRRELGAIVRHDEEP